MKVWIFQTGEPLHLDSGNPRPMRAMNLSNTLVDAGHDVVLWSSAFHHQKKQHRCKVYKIIEVMDRLEIRLIPSMGYTRNVGVGRLADHAQLSYRLKKLLQDVVELPDVVFIGYPPIETACVLTLWCKKRNIPTLLDVKDLWPSMFLDALPRVMRPLGKVGFSPYFYFAKKAMRDATGLSTMAPAFLDWSLQFTGKIKTTFDGVFPLTSPAFKMSEDDSMKAMEWWGDHHIRQDKQYKVCFVGSLSPAFDFKPIRDAAKAMIKNGLNCQFIICGDGSVSDEVKAMMYGLPNVFFSGWIDRPKIEALSTMCHASLAPYVNIGNFTMNIPNKIVDSLSLGLPILSPLQGEVANLVSTHHVGLRYGMDTDKSLYDCIFLLMHDQELQQTMSENGKDLYDERFSFDKVYGSLVSHLERMVASDA